MLYSTRHKTAPANTKPQRQLDSDKAAAVLAILNDRLAKYQSIPQVITQRPVIQVNEEE